MSVPKIIPLPLHSLQEAARERMGSAAAEAEFAEARKCISSCVERT